MEELNQRVGCELEVVGLADQTGGTSSAAFVRWPDGRDAVLTRTKTPLARMRQTADVLYLALSRGLLVPRHDVVLELADGYVAVVQERLPGRPPDRVDAAVIDAMVATNERFAGLLADRPDVAEPAAFGPFDPRHQSWEETLGRYSDRSRRLLTRICEIGGGEPHQMTGDDLVHIDYILGNVLHDQHGRVTGVIDWNAGVARGDRRFALIALCVDLEGDRHAPGGGPHGVQPDAIDRLDEIVRQTIDPDLLYIYRAHWRVYGVHRLIHLNRTRAQIDHALQAAETQLA